MKKQKGINLSETVLSEEDKKKVQELGKPKSEPEKKKKEENKKEPYVITLFKMKDKPNWRMSSENPFLQPEKMTEMKIIKIDRVTGEIIN
ncbi:hypothetical protein M0R04_13760 [Candidatus Dojkabacteria bacterium]|jgi:hypothetical protein|nr:hypothetical protein [Candidatus Dojkabacteria bacterium]